jgi:hypothetical protein
MQKSNERLIDVSSATKNAHHVHNAFALESNASDTGTRFR